MTREYHPLVLSRPTGGEARHLVVRGQRQLMCESLPQTWGIPHGRYLLCSVSVRAGSTQASQEWPAWKIDLSHQTGRISSGEVPKGPRLPRDSGSPSRAGQYSTNTGCVASFYRPASLIEAISVDEMQCGPERDTRASRLPETARFQLQQKATDRDLRPLTLPLLGPKQGPGTTGWRATGFGEPILSGSLDA